MEESTQAELSPFQVAVLVLSLFVFAVLAIELVVPLDPEIQRLAGWVDDAVCVVLFTDFVVRFRRAESKLEFLRWGWIDLVASIPVIEALRWGRALRVLRVLRLIRAVRSLRAFLSVVFQRRGAGGVVTVATVAFLTIALASLGILAVEPRAEANITTAEDALWWSFATVTTVGYGDVYPVSEAGRAIATALMIVGVGLFGVLSGSVASIFLGDDTRDDDAADRSALSGELRALREEVAALRAELDAQRTREEPSGEARRDAG